MDDWSAAGKSVKLPGFTGADDRRLRITCNDRGIPVQRPYIEEAEHLRAVGFWMSVVECATALVLVLVILLPTEVTSETAAEAAARAQKIRTLWPDQSDQSPADRRDPNAGLALRPTHKLVALSSSESGDLPMVIELDAPLPNNQPVRFLIIGEPQPKP